VWVAPAEPAPDAEKSTMQIDSLFKNWSKKREKLFGFCIEKSTGR
jgi:hypothetical protein